MSGVHKNTDQQHRFVYIQHTFTQQWAALRSEIKPQCTVYPAVILDGGTSCGNFDVYDIFVHFTECLSSHTLVLLCFSHANMKIVIALLFLLCTYALFNCIFYLFFYKQKLLNAYSTHKMFFRASMCKRPGT